MHANRNKNAINRVSKELLKANKARNIFAIIAIILTTFMITTVFSLGISYRENYQVMLIRDTGTTASISLKLPTAEQYEKIKSLDYLDAVGTQLNIGSIMCKTESGSNTNVSLMYYDDSEWKNHYLPAISSIEGNYPKNENEIMLSENAMELLGIDKRLNKTVNLSFESRDGTQNGEFIISGWFKSYSIDKLSMILFSDEYCKNNGITLQNNGTVFISAKNASDAYDKLLEDVELNDNQAFDSTFRLDDTSETIQMAILIILIVSFIMISGFLLIYNVFYISVSKDIKRYGMLKTLGTSSKQIHKVITNQALMLSAIGIPSGLILNTLFSIVIVPFALENITGYEAVKASFSPIIYIGASLFSLLTVMISVWKSAKIAGRISPTEALRYNSVNVSSTKKTERKTSGKVRNSNMAWRNIFRNKKQTFLVVISLFIGCVTLLGINTFLDSITVEAYARKYIKHDFVLENEMPIEDEFSDEFIDKLKNINGVKSFNISYASFVPIEFDEKSLDPILKNAFVNGGGDLNHMEYYNNFLQTMRDESIIGKYGSWVQTIDTSIVEKYNKTHENKVNIEDFENGTAVIMLYNGSDIGATPTFYDDSGNKLKTEIAGAMPSDEVDSYSIPGGSVVMGMPGVIYASENFFKQLECNENIFTIAIDIDENLEKEITDEIEELCNSLRGATYHLYSKTDIIESFKENQIAERIIGNSVSVLFLAIGILNFINLMMTGIFSRKYEFAVMQSIGVTNKQMRKLITVEGLYYAVMTTALILTVGNVFVYIVTRLMPAVADFAVFKYPLLPLILLLSCIFVICIAVPFTVYRLSSKATITERLRDIEN